MTLDQSTLLLISGIAVGSFVLGQILAGCLAVVFFHYGSSSDSRAAHVVIAGQLGRPPQQASPLSGPEPLVAKPTQPSATPTMIMTGKMSVFGGPNDTGMAPDEGLALYEPSTASLIAGFLLPDQPPGTTGLGRRLDPSKLYIACRWDYARTPKTFLRTVGVHVTAQGKTINCRPVDWGPAASTGRIADLSPGAAAALGIHTDDTVTVTIPLPGAGAQNPVNIAPVGTEPLWLTLARAEIGFHETGDNRGIQRYVDLAGYGVEGEPWCAIFAGAMLRKAGVSVEGCNAMAQSFAHSPAFTKLDGFRKGAIAVFWRGSRDSGQGHVGFADGETATHVQTLGGNENDQVEIESIPKNGSTMGLLGYWWPVSVPEPKVT